MTDDLSGLLSIGIDDMKARWFQLREGQRSTPPPPPTSTDAPPAAAGCTEDADQSHTGCTCNEFLAPATGNRRRIFGQTGGASTAATAGAASTVLVEVAGYIALALHAREGEEITGIYL